MRVIGSAKRRIRRARENPVVVLMLARSDSRPIQKAEPSSPSSGPEPPARAHRPRPSRPRRHRSGAGEEEDAGRVAEGAEIGGLHVGDDRDPAREPVESPRVMPPFSPGPHASRRDDERLHVIASDLPAAPETDQAGGEPVQPRRWLPRDRAAGHADRRRGRGSTCRPGRRQHAILTGSRPFCAPRHCASRGRHPGIRAGIMLAHDASPGDDHQSHLARLRRALRLRSPALLVIGGAFSREQRGHGATSSSPGAASRGGPPACPFSPPRSARSPSSRCPPPPTARTGSTRSSSSARASPSSPSPCSSSPPSTATTARRSTSSSSTASAARARSPAPSSSSSRGSSARACG